MRYINPSQAIAEPKVKSSSVLALDTETRGVARRSEIVMLIVCTLKDEFAWDVRNGKWPKWINKYLNDKDILKIGHNLLFDGTLIETQHGVKIFHMRDTMLQEKIIQGIETPFTVKDEKVKLKYSIALKYTLARYKLDAKIEFDTKVFATWDRPFTPLMYNYGFGDTNKLIKLDALQRKHERYNKAVFDLENEVLEVYINMRVVGINFDKQHWLTMAKGYNKIYLQRKKEFDELLSKEAKSYNSVKHYDVTVNEKGTKFKTLNPSVMPESININSSQQVKKLFALRGIIIESYTDFKRMYSKNKVEYNDKLLDKFFEVRDFYQLAGTFGVKWLKEDTDSPTIDPIDGRVHPDFTQIISTGRSSCSNPNLQQLPAYKAKELKGLLHRAAFIATKGFSMNIRDFASQELALLMLLANESVWLDHIASGRDSLSILTEMAQPQKWREGTERGCEFKKSQRKCECREHGQLRTYTKKVIYGKPYGKGITSIAEDLAMTYEEAKPIVKSIERVLPRLMRWMETIKKETLKTNSTYTLPPFKRYRKLEFFFKPKSRFSEKDVAKRFMSEAERMKTKGSSKDNWRKAMIADNDDWRIKNQGVNSPIQGSGADMLKYAMVLLWRWINEKKFPARILLPIHDALLTESLKSKEKIWDKVVREKMEEAAALVTRGQSIIKTEGKISNHWI